MKKRIFASLLALVMAFSLLPASALAEARDWDPLTSIDDVAGWYAGRGATGRASTTLTIGAGVGKLKTMPTMDYGNYSYNAMAYCGATATSSNPDVLEVNTKDGHPDIVIGTWQGGSFNGADCLQVNTTPKKAGTAVVTIQFYYTFSQSSNPFTNPNAKWLFGTTYYTVTVVDPNAKPNKPTEKDIASFSGNVGNVSGVSVALFCDSGEEDHTSLYTISNDGNHNLDYWGNYTLGDVVENPGTLGMDTTAYPYVCPMTIDASGFLALYNNKYESEVGTHALASGQGNPVVYWFWAKTDKIWKYKGSDAPVEINITCKQDPDAGQLDTAIAAVEVQVACASETTHTPAKYPIGSNAKIEKQVTGDTATITLTAPADYASLYQAGGKTHTYDEKNTGNRLTFTMKWKKNATNVWGWYLEGDAPQIMTTCTSTPEDATLTIVKKVSSKLDEDADFTFTLKRYILSENPSGSEALYTEDSAFSHEPIIVRVAKGSDTGSATVDLPEIPISTVYTVAEENLSDPDSGNHELKMAGTTGVFSKAEYSCEMSSKDENGNPISTGEMAPCDSFSALWPGQEITSVTITCTNTYELTPPAKFPVTVNKSYASSTGAGNYAADETVTIHAGSRSNYKFNGWTSDSTDVTFANAKKAVTTFTMPKHAVTVTASWTYTGSSHDDDDYDYTLRYVTNGGKAISSESKSRSWVKDYEDLPVPTRVGYRFNGWYYDTKLTKAVTGDVQVSSRTVTLYAGWTENSVPAILNGDDHFAYIQGYDDGTVRPNTPVTRAQVATILFRLLDEDVRDKYLTETNTFTDVAADYWANTAISTMASLGVFKGRTADRFDPNAPITRGEFAAVCARFDDSSVQSSNAFSDIDGYWAKQEILRAAALGWVQGYQDGTFRPTASITRAQVVTMINRVLCRQPETASDLLRGMTTFTDCAEGDWCYLAIQEAANSHDYVGKSGSIYESWTDLNKSADWSKYEH